MPTIPPSRPRIHRKALRRGGVGAGLEGMTRNLMHRARGKWSPSGDTGEMAGYRTDPAVSCPERRVGRACAAHKGAELADASASSAGMETGRVVAAPSAVSPRRALRMSNGHALPGNRRSTPSSPAFAERPESRAKTAERGAGRCHLTLFTRGSFRRPVRMLFETTSETAAAWISVLAARPTPANAKFFPFPRNMR